MFSRLIWGSLTALLLPVGMVMAQGHGHTSGHGAPAHASGHAGSTHWSGHPSGSFGVPHASNANHNVYRGARAGYSWRSDFNRGGDFQRRDFDRRDFGRRDFDRDFGRRDFDRRGLAFRYPYYGFGRGVYPYAYWGYPYWGYGYAGYPYGYYSGYSSWYPYSSWSPYDSGYAYSNPDYAYPDYGVAPYDGVYPPGDSGYGAPTGDEYGAAPSYTQSATSRITITVPPGADIWVEGVKIASGSGAVHTFQTPPLNPDQQYRYRVRAVWTGPDGHTIDQSQEIVFSAGAGVAVRFPTAQVPWAPQA
jgi:uncharacterized protein (TIGR03000 family)